MNASKDHEGPGRQEAYDYASQVIAVSLSSALVVVMLFLLLVCCNSSWYSEDLSNDNQSEKKSDWEFEMRNKNRVVRGKKKKERKNNCCIEENDKECKRPRTR